MNDYLAKISKNDKVPSPPTVASRLLELFSIPDVDVGEITKTLSTDVGLSAKLISYCNSPLVGSRREIGSLRQAVMVLGLRTTRLLALSFSIMETENDSPFNFKEFWMRSLATAVASKTLANHLGENGDEALLFGLVLNVGQIGIGISCPELLAEHGGDDGLTIKQETELLGVNRYQVGGMMLQNWNFPQEIIDTVATFQPTNTAPKEKQLVLSQRLASTLLANEVSSQEISDTRNLASSLCGIDDGFAEYFDTLIAEWKGYEPIFDFESLSYDSIEELESRARDSLIQVSLGMDAEIDRISHERAQLEESAMVDSLTTLKNRRAYDNELPAIVSKQRRENRAIGVIIVDIDHFKSFNDTHGHAFGDTVLREVGKCLGANCRQYDSVYRYGGEEFVVMVQDCKFEDLVTIADRLRTAVESLRIDDLKVTASLGGCWSKPACFEDASDLFEAADKNLYVAKENGRNRSVIGRFGETILAC